MNGSLCTTGGFHRAGVGTIKNYREDESKTAECDTCGLQIRSFWVDDDDDRRGGWSKWTALRYVIEELEEL